MKILKWKFKQLKQWVIFHTIESQALTIEIVKKKKLN